MLRRRRARRAVERCRLPCLPRLLRVVPFPFCRVPVASRMTAVHRTRIQAVVGGRRSAQAPAHLAVERERERWMHSEYTARSAVGRVHLFVCRHSLENANLPTVHRSEQSGAAEAKGLSLRVSQNVRRGFNITRPGETPVRSHLTLKHGKCRVGHGDGRARVARVVRCLVADDEALVLAVHAVERRRRFLQRVVGIDLGSASVLLDDGPGEQCNTALCPAPNRCGGLTSKG